MSGSFGSWFVIPPCLAEESTPSLAKKVKIESAGESLKSPGRPPKKSQNRVSWRLCESNITCFFDSGHSFLTLFWGMGRDFSETPRRLPRRLLFDFLGQGGFVSSAMQGGGVVNLGGFSADALGPKAHSGPFSGRFGFGVWGSARL